MAKLKKQTQSQIDGVAYRRSPTWQIALAMLNNGSSMAFYVLVGLMSYVANQGYGIALAVAGGLFTGTRIFDGLIDPILAVIMDKFNTRFGKLRILLGIGFIIRSLAIFSLFIWFADKGHGVVWFVITYMLYIVGSSTCDIAGNMVGPIMSNDPKQRPLIGVWGTVYSYLFPMIFSLISTMVILPKYNNQYTVPMMAEVCIINVAASLVLLLLACIGLTPVDKPENFKGISAAGKEDSVTFKDMLAFLKGNKAFRLYLVQGVSEKLAQQTGSQAIVTTLFYGILIGNMQFGSILQIVSMLPAIVFAIIGARFAGKHGNKESAVIWMRVSIVLAALNILFCAFTDMSKIPSTMLLLVPFFILQLILNGSKMCITTSSTAMRADIIDYELDRGGKYLPATVTATYNFVDQFVTSLGSTIAAVGVSFVGYATTVPQPGDAATPAILWMSLFLLYGLPILGWIGGLLAMKGYHLTKPEMVQVQKRVQASKEAAAAEG